MSFEKSSVSLMFSLGHFPAVTVHSQILTHLGGEPRVTLSKTQLCYIHVHIGHMMRVQERTERGFLNTLLAYSVQIGLSLPDTGACAHCRKWLGAKCQSKQT